MKDLLIESLKTIRGLLVPVLVFFLSREVGFYLYIKSMISSAEKENVNTLALHSEMLYQIYVNFHPLAEYMLANEICSMVMLVHEENENYIYDLIFSASIRIAAYETVNPLYRIAKIANNQASIDLYRKLEEADMNREYLR